MWREAVGRGHRRSAQQTLAISAVDWLIVGDQPVYVLYLELKSRIAKLSTKLYLSLDLSTSICHSSTLYSGGSKDLASKLFWVAAGVIADASVDQALRWKYVKRMVWCLWLFYETGPSCQAKNTRLKAYSLSEEVETFKQCSRTFRFTWWTKYVADLNDLVDTLFMTLRVPNKHNTGFPSWKWWRFDSKHPCHQSSSLQSTSCFRECESTTMTSSRCYSSRLLDNLRMCRPCHWDRANNG